MSVSRMWIALEKEKNKTATEESGCTVQLFRNGNEESHCVHLDVSIEQNKRTNI